MSQAESPKAILDELTRTVVPLAFATATFVYFLLAVGEPWLGHADQPWYLVVNLWAGAVVCGAAALYTSMRRVSARWAHPALVGCVLLLAISCGAFLYWAKDPIHTTNHMLLLVALAAGLLSRFWFALGAGIVWASWGVSALSVGPFTPEWRHWTAMMALRQHRLRALAEAREADLAEALAAAERANVSRLEMQQRMQEALRRESLGVLAGGIAHDFNNLLTVIGGNLELLESSAAEPRLEADAQEAVGQATRLTQQMLTYAGRAPRRVEPIAVGRRILETTRLLESSLPASTSIEVLSVCEDAIVDADGAQVDQLILNVLQNAVDACRDQGGRIEIGCAVEELSEKDLGGMRFSRESLPGPYVVVSVRDTGRGMEREERERMFDPFFTTKPTGSGLGLASVEGILESHCGAVSVSSVPGEGTWVRLALPLRHAHASRVASSASPETVAEVERGTILVVDDRPEVRRVARELLASAGFGCREAGSRDEAVARLSQVPELTGALVDLTMPGGNGYEVAAALLEVRPGLKIVIMSGFDRDDAGPSVGDAYEFAFVSKPFSRSELIEAFRD